MKTFIRVTEVWVPSNDRTILEYRGGLYGDAAAFGLASRKFCFGRGEGLPGQAWEQGHPVVLQDLATGNFRRKAEAKAAGLTCGIAVPIFAGDFLTSVLVFFCGDDAERAGAIELWHNNAAESYDMRLVDGYYGNTGDVFEFASRRTVFRRGHGLPGVVWETGAPYFIPDLGKSDRFLRADSATKVGINRGFALPCPGLGAEDTYVLAFLSALGTPIARRFEVWKPDASRQQLTRQEGFCETGGDLGASRITVDKGQGAIGTAFLTGVPALSDNAGAEPGETGAQAVAAGLNALVAVPIVREGRLTNVVAWYF